jgi:hypothetical protein
VFIVPRLILISFLKYWANSEYSFAPRVALTQKLPGKIKIPQITLNQFKERPPVEIGSKIENRLFMRGIKKFNPKKN